MRYNAIACLLICVAATPEKTMICGRRQAPEPLSEHHRTNIETVRKIRYPVFSAAVSITAQHRKHLIVPDAVFIAILTVTREDIAAVAVKADHPVQHRLTGRGAQIKRYVVSLQLAGLFG